jgi:hypothetical protein
VRPVKVRDTTYYAHELATQLMGAGKVKLVVSWKEAGPSGSPKYHAASQRGWQAGGILGHNVRRWEVEDSPRDAKQHLGLGGCQMRSPEGTRRHWYLALLKFTPLKLMGCQAGSMKGSGENGGITLGDSQRALRNGVLFDLIEYVLRRILGEAGALSAEKQGQLAGLMRELVR